MPRPELTELLARSLSLLGSERAWVVHGADGLDELSTTGYTKVSESRGESVQTFYVHPADFGLAKATPESLKGGDAATNAAIVRAVLSGEAGPQRDVVLLNAGAAMFVAGQVDTVKARHRQNVGRDRQRRGHGRLEEPDCGFEQRSEAREHDAGSARGDRRRHARPR